MAPKKFKIFLDSIIEHKEHNALKSVFSALIIRTDASFAISNITLWLLIPVALNFIFFMDRYGFSITLIYLNYYLLEKSFDLNLFKDQIQFL